MNFRKPASAVVLLLLALALSWSAAHADSVDQAMKLTVSQPVEIPGKILPAGTYWFMRPGLSQPNMLEILNADKSMVIATLFTRPERFVSKPTGGIGVTLAERSDQPRSLLGLTYPGRAEGHAFYFEYPTERQKELSDYHQVTRIVDDKGEVRIDKIK